MSRRLQEPEPPSPSRRRRKRAPHLPRAGEGVLLAFVAVALLLLAVIPVGVERAIEPHREHTEEVIQPARELVAEIESRLAQEVSLSRGYLLTRDDAFLQEYRRVQEEQRRSLRRLRALSAGLPAPLAARIHELGGLLVERHEPVTGLRRGEITPDEYVRRLDARQELLRETVAAARRLSEELARAERTAREEIRGLRRYQDWASLGLIVLSAAAVVAVGFLGLRLRRAAREEAALRRVANALNAALGINQIARWITGNALSLVHADGAYLERAGPAGEVEVVAAAGLAAPLSGARVPSPGSLVPEQVERGDPRRFGKEVELPLEALDTRCGDCTGVVLPLLYDRGLLGALVLLRAPGRPPFSGDEERRGSMLADLASLAMRKILLLQEAHDGKVRAEHLLEARSRLVRGLSHDLRNPLGAMIGYADLLLSDTAGPLTEEQRRFAERIRRAGRSMDRMITHLLEVGRSESAEVPVRLAPVRVAEVVADVAEEHRPDAERAGLQLRVEAPRETEALTDPLHLRTILGNLLSNAVKYTDAGRVEVRADLRSDPDAPGPGEWVTLTVSDTGPGIAPEEQEEIFEEFSRFHPGRAPGEGIGLASSRHVARLLGGDLTVRSTPGKGSAFIVWLPAAGAGPHPGGTPPAGRAEEVSGR